LVAVLAAALVVLVLVLMPADKPGPKQVMAALRELPDRLVVHQTKADDQVLEGRAWTRRDVAMRFYVAVGSARLPSFTESKRWSASGGTAFAYADNWVAPAHRHPRAWSSGELPALGTAIEETLCETFTGESCGI
jgi:hypothetical protein